MNYEVAYREFYKRYNPVIPQQNPDKRKCCQGFLCF